MELNNTNKTMRVINNRLVGGIIIVVLVLGFLALRDKTPKYLDAPILKETLTKVSSSLPLAGLCYPKADVLVLSKERLIQSTECNQNGEFATTLTFNEEGRYELSIKQRLKEVTSESVGHNIEVDLTPPIEDLKLSKLPEFSNEKTITITGGTKATAASLLLNEREYKIDESGKLSVQFLLKEGKNNLTFRLIDEVGNKTKVLVENSIRVDSVPPKIATGGCSLYLSRIFAALGETEEYVCVKTGKWQSWGNTASVPIIGNVKGEFSSITVDGKRIYPDEEGEIFQRVSLYTPYGSNRYKVVAIDEAGNKSTANLEMNVVNADDNSDSTDEILDRLDDIESQL